MEKSADKDKEKMIDFDQILSKIIKEKNKIISSLADFASESEDYILSNYKDGVDPQEQTIIWKRSIEEGNLSNYERRITNQMRPFEHLKDAIVRVCELHENIPQDVCFGRYKKKVPGKDGASRLMEDIKNAECLEGKEDLRAIPDTLVEIIGEMNNLRKVRNKITHSNSRHYFLINSKDMDTIELRSTEEEDEKFPKIKISNIKRNLERLLEEIKELIDLDSLSREIKNTTLIGIFSRQNKIYLADVRLRHELLNFRKFSAKNKIRIFIDSIKTSRVYTHDGDRTLSGSYEEEDIVLDKVYLMVRHSDMFGERKKYPKSVRFGSTGNSIRTDMQFEKGSEIKEKEIKEYLDCIPRTLSDKITFDKEDFGEIIKNTTENTQQSSSSWFNYIYEIVYWLCEKISWRS